MSRIRNYWLLGERLTALVTSPATDVVEADRAIEALVVTSRLVGRWRALGSKISAAWWDSACRRLLRATQLDPS